MKRRVFLYASIAVGATALAPARISLAAEQPAPGTITTVAGTGQPGFSGDNGPAAEAQLDDPFGIAIDAAGNVFIGDGANSRVRKVSPDGIITTVAGNGVSGFSGDGGPATEARLAGALWLASDRVGNLYLSDWSHNRVRKVSPDGIITTVAGTGPTTDEAPGDYTGDGGPATAARLYYPQGLAVDAAGNLFIADSENHRIRKVRPDGTITTVAGSGPTGPDKGSSTGDGGPAIAATLRGPMCLAVDGSGNLFFTEKDPLGTSAAVGGYTGPRFQVRKVSADGIITTVASNGVKGFSGDGGLAMEASLDNPSGVAVDMAGNLFIADYNNYRVRKVDPNGMISTVAGTGMNPYVGDGVLATATGLRGPEGLVIDAAGNLLISDSGEEDHQSDGLPYNERVLKVVGVAAPGLLAGMPFPKPQ
jgi:sugar lactone lactonase YvrE